METNFLTLAQWTAHAWRQQNCASSALRLCRVHIKNGQGHSYWSRDKWTPFCRQHFRIHFLDEKWYILIQVAMKFVSNNKLALVQIMAWHWIGDKPLFEPMLKSASISKPIIFIKLVFVTIEVLFFFRSITELYTYTHSFIAGAYIYIYILYIHICIYICTMHIWRSLWRQCNVLLISCQLHKRPFAKVADRYINVHACTCRSPSIWRC